MGLGYVQSHVSVSATGKWNMFALKATGVNTKTSVFFCVFFQVSE